VTISKVHLSKRRQLIFALIPVCIIILLAEVFFRFSGLAKSPITPMSLPGEQAGIYRFDKDLFWALKPNQRRSFQDVTVSTNSDGLRSDEIGERGSSEFRILSVGESTTFGAGVENAQTYSDVLQTYLNRAFSDRDFRVINGGVSAYSSFQSLTYLRTAGLELKPNMVIFYHEFNDYLPTYLRASDNTVISMGLTDQERFESRSRRFQRMMLSYSATYRFVSYRIAFNKIQAVQKQTPEQAAAYGRSMAAAVVGDTTRSIAFPTRVSPQERAENLAQLLQICREHEIQLVIIHPSYRDSVSHTCILTRFCQQHDIPMLEAHDVLHPPGSSPRRYFWDGMHPTADGHQQLAKHLYHLLVDEQLVGENKPENAPFEEDHQFAK